MAAKSDSLVMSQSSNVRLAEMLIEVVRNHTVLYDKRLPKPKGCFLEDDLRNKTGNKLGLTERRKRRSNGVFCPGHHYSSIPAAEDGAPSTIDPSKTRKPKKHKGHRAGSTKEPKGNKQSIMTPMNGNDEELAAGVSTPSVATTPKSTHVLSPSSQSTTPTPRSGESRSNFDRRAPISDRNADTSASTDGSSIASPVSPAPRASEIRGMNHQQAEQERGPRKDREKDRPKGKPWGELVQPQDKPIATSAVPECFSPSSEEQKPVSSLTQAKPEENNEPLQALLKDATSTSEQSKPLQGPPFCYSVAVSAALLFAGGAVVGLLMWLQVNHVEVRTKSGSTVPGFRSYVANYRIYTFLGIPYAQPPVQNLRFRLPLPYIENSSVVPATLECPPCPQRGWFSPMSEGWEGEEECLHLNVWTPCAETTTGGGCAKLPILLFLFAEGFQTGSNMRFDGSLLAGSQNLVVIAPNFRIGVLGFFHKDGHDMPGNLALHDQELVIKWVEDHADLFGGNWNNTVLMGAATGARSIGAHLVSMNPFWRWRTQRLLLHSESPFRRIHSASPSTFADAVGCGQNQSSSRCFTDMPLEMVMEAGRLFPFGPYYEFRLLPQAPWHMARRFNIIEKQVVLGTVLNEGSPLAEILARDGDSSDASMRAAIRELLTSCGINDSGKLVDYYSSGAWPGQRGVNRSWAQQLLGDVFFECPVLSFANHLSARGNRVYVYRFDHKPSFTKFHGQSGASRLEDIEFLFGTLIQDGTGTFEETTLSSSMMQMLSTFIRNGSLPRVDGDEWPLYTREKRKRVSIRSDGLRILPGDTVDKCYRLYESFMPELMFNEPI